MTRTIEEILQNVTIDELELTPRGAVPPETPLEEVYRLLDEQRPGAVVVCEETAVKGIFTERDVLYRTAQERLDASTPVAELMSTDPKTLRPDQTLAEAIALMVDGGYRHVPLVSGAGQCLGLLSSRDVLRFIADHFPEAVLNLPPRLHQELRRPEGG